MSLCILWMYLYTHTERYIYIAEHTGPYGEIWDTASLLLALTSLNSNSFKHAKATPSRAIMEKNKLKTELFSFILSPTKMLMCFAGWYSHCLGAEPIFQCGCEYDLIWDMVCTEVDASPTPSGDLIGEQSSECNKNPSSLWPQHLKNYT